MRKVKTLLLFSLLVLVICSCEKEHYGFINVRREGKPVTNPTNSQWCKPLTAEATLSSLRRVSDRLYYMDYVTDLQLDDILSGNYRTREAFLQAFSNYMYTPEGEEPILPEMSKACSGFVCHNEQGELLLCRNYDGDDCPLVILFNTANGYKNVQFTGPSYNSPLYMNEDYTSGDGILSDGKTSLHRLMSEPLSVLDGMNEYGLCFGAYQLPPFDYVHINPVHQTSHNDAMNATLLHNLVLSKCKTVKEVEQYLQNHDYVSTNMILNVHWMMADATGDWAIFEYWNDTLHVYREDQLYQMSWYAGGTIPYEWFSIENYYRSWEPYSSYPTPGEVGINDWQVAFSPKIRVTHMMNAYKPVMKEMDALRCLQEGNFGLEVLNHVTGWSCVYNTVQRTIIFSLRNDMSQIYRVDLKKDLK